MKPADGSSDRRAMEDALTDASFDSFPEADASISGNRMKSYPGHPQ
jgi:hypothetical protein